MRGERHRLTLLSLYFIWNNRLMFLWSYGKRRTWSYGCWIYNYLCNQCLSPLMLWVRISIRARCTTLCDKVCQWLATARWFSPDPPFSSTNKTDCQDITEIFLKVALNTIKQTKKQTQSRLYDNLPKLDTVTRKQLFPARVSHRTSLFIHSFLSGALIRESKSSFKSVNVYG